MAITIEKKKLALRSATVAAPEAQVQGGMAAQHPVFMQEQKTPSYTVFGILGILAFLQFSALLLVQWIEFSKMTEPGMFPVLTPQAAPTVSAAAPPPAE